MLVLRQSRRLAARVLQRVSPSRQPTGPYAGVTRCRGSRRRLSSTRVSGAVTCPYHAWTYNLDGTLRAAPFIQFDASCPKEGFSLVPIHLDTWGGFIFLNLAQQRRQPLLEQLAGPVRRLARYPLQDLRRGAQLVYDVRANWKVIMENYNECYHCGPAHPELCALVPAFRERGGAGLDWDDGIPHRAGAWTFTLDRHLDPRAVPRAFGEGEDPSQGRNLLSKPASQRRGRTRRGIHALAKGAGSHAHRLRIPVSHRPRSRSPDSTRATSSISGTS